MSSRVRSTTKSRSGVTYEAAMRAFPSVRANGLSCGAMNKLASLFILGILLLAAGSTAGAAPSPSNWASLDADAVHSNNNSTETTLTARNVLKLKVKWTAPETNLSYPIVADGSVYIPVLEGRKTHVRVVSPATGKPLGTFTKDALGGMLLRS